MWKTFGRVPITEIKFVNNHEIFFFSYAVIVCQGSYPCCVCTGLVMALQFRYQRAKMYRKVALGLKHHMSVSHGMKRDWGYNNILFFRLWCPTTSAESKLAIKNLLLGLVGVYVSSMHLCCKSRMLVFS